MNSPQSLSVEEIRQYMLENGCKVTNHALVKHFKSFLTNPSTQNDARKQFKTYVNILATIKNENNQKYLILRKKYFDECPSADMADRALAASDCVPGSPGGNSLISESGLSSPFRQPPPYKPPPQVSTAKAAPSAVILSSSQTSVQKEHVENYRDCVNEFAVAVNILDSTRLENQNTDVHTTESVVVSAEEKQLHDKCVSLEKVTEQGANKENIARFSFSSGTSGTSIDSTSVEKVSNSDGEVNENPISVKEATKKFNRMASEEESKIISPPAKKKPEKQLIEVNVSQEVLLSHAKSKEWIVSMAKANYQEIAKLANEFPELVKLQDPSTTALHWAAKHGNEDVVKLIAGTYNADVNSKTGYTPLHLAMQFGRDNIFELLCNVYKANRDIMDWSGNKPLDYLKQRTSISQSTYSKIKARKKHAVEKDLGFLRIGSLNVRVKKTTEAFSNFLGVGNCNSNANHQVSQTTNQHHQRHHRHHYHTGTTRNHHTHPRTMNAPISRHHQLISRSSVPINITNIKFKKQMLKSWGSADNIPHLGSVDDSKIMMPPPNTDFIKKRNKSSKHSSIMSITTDRDSKASFNSSSNLNSGYSSMPTTPNQLRSPISIGLSAEKQLFDSDSDSACGFGSNWSVGGGNSSNVILNKDPRYV